MTKKHKNTKFYDVEGLHGKDREWYPIRMHITLHNAKKAVEAAKKVRHVDFNYDELMWVELRIVEVPALSDR